MFSLGVTPSEHIPSSPSRSSDSPVNKKGFSASKASLISSNTNVLNQPPKMSVRMFSKSAVVNIAPDFKSPQASFTACIASSTLSSSQPAGSLNKSSMLDPTSFNLSSNSFHVMSDIPGGRGKSKPGIVIMSPTFTQSFHPGYGSFPPAPSGSTLPVQLSQSLEIPDTVLSSFSPRSFKSSRLVGRASTAELRRPSATSIIVVSSIGLSGSFPSHSKRTRVGTPSGYSCSSSSNVFRPPVSGSYGPVTVSPF